MPKNKAYDHDWATVRRAILARDQHVCQLRLAGCTTKANHVDHVVPLVEGGARLDPDNLRASCRNCNLTRSTGRIKALSAALTEQPTPSPSRKW